MKIAILTLPLHTNYGGILQCYALQTVLERQGYDVKVLTKPLYTRTYYIIWFFAIIKRFFKRIFLGEKISILYAPYQLEIKNVRKNTNLFIDRYIHKYLTRSLSKKISKKFDAIIVGSDQVWRAKYVNLEDYFLSFLGDEKIKRIAYAASFGVDNISEYSPEQLEKCIHLLRKFDYVSVRELSGVNICHRYFNINAIQLLDPTLLLAPNDYLSLIDKKNINEPLGNMLVYILDKTDEKVQLVNKIAAERGLVPFWIGIENKSESLSTGYSVKISVEQWLYSFEKADFVFTDSFHGCAFSILFNKQFIVIGNKERGMSRFTSLLSIFQLDERLIYSKNDYENRIINLSTDIDYKIINNILSIERDKSYDFFYKSLNL